MFVVGRRLVLGVWCRWGQASTPGPSGLDLPNNGAGCHAARTAGSVNVTGLKTKDDVIAAIRATLGQMQEKSDYEEQLDTLVKHRGRHQLQEFIRLYENVSEQLSVQLLQVEELPELHTMDD